MGWYPSESCFLGTEKHGWPTLRAIFSLILKELYSYGLNCFTLLK